MAINIRDSTTVDKSFSENMLCISMQFDNDNFLWKRGNLKDLLWFLFFLDK
jgi:hypothetical protein